MLNLFIYLFLNKRTPNKPTPSFIHVFLDSWAPGLRINVELRLNLIEILVDVPIISGIESHMGKLIAFSSEQHLNNM